MANTRRNSVSAMIAFLTLAGTNMRRALAAAVTVLFAVTCMAQNQAQNQTQSQPPSSPDSQTSAPAPATPNPATETVPAGTRFALVLTNPIFSNTTHRGDEIHAQTTAPITIGDHVVIPGGIFVQGKVDKLTRHGTSSTLAMQSVAVVFPDGYVASIAGPLNIETEEGTAWANPSSGVRAGAIIAPAAGLGLGALIGSAAHTTRSTSLGGTTITSSSIKGVAIGSLVGLAAGGVVSIALLLHSHQFFVDIGSPMDMTLPQSLTLSADQVADANRVAQEHPAATPTPAPRPQPVVFFPNHGTCMTPSTPGTPPTVIPGAPGPNGVPGPPTVIPGTPPTPGTPYPCP